MNSEEINNWLTEDVKDNDFGWMDGHKYVFRNIVFYTSKLFQNFLYLDLKILLDLAQASKSIHHFFLKLF